MHICYWPTGTNCSLYFILQAVTLAGIWIVIYSGHFCHPRPEIHKITLFCDGKKMGNCTCSQTHLEHQQNFSSGSKMRFLKMENLWVQNTGMYCWRGIKNFTCSSTVEVLGRVPYINVLRLYLEGVCFEQWVPPVISVIFHAFSSVLSGEYWHNTLNRPWVLSLLIFYVICHLIWLWIMYEYSNHK